MKNLLKKAGIAGISCLCAFMAAGAGNRTANLQPDGTLVIKAEAKQAKKVYKYKQAKRQVDGFSSIKADFGSLDMVIQKSGNKNFYISYNLNCNNSSNPLSYKVENGILSIKESKLEWPSVYISNKDKQGTSLNYKNYSNKIYVYIPSGTNLENCDMNIGAGDLSVKSKNISLEGGKINAGSGDLDIAVSKIQGNMDIKTGSGDIDLNTDRDTDINTNINGSLNINTGSGDVDIRKSVINKLVKIKTGSGDAGINADINGQLDVNTGSGDVDTSKSVINKTFNIKTSSGDIEIDNSDIKGKLAIQSSSGDIDAVNLNISGNADIKTSSGDVDIKLNSKYTDKLGIKMFTKGGGMYIKKSYKGTKRRKRGGYEYTRNADGNKKPLLDVMVTGWGDIELR